MRVLTLALLVVVILASSGCESIRAFRERNRLRTFQPWEVVPLEHAGWRSPEERELNLERLHAERLRRPYTDFRWIDQF